MQPTKIKELIEAQLPGAQVSVEGDDGVHFAATVIYTGFEGKSRVEQQQMVYAALATHITSGNIHALSLKTYTPGENQTR